jgi:hypothetical protein
MRKVILGLIVLSSISFGAMECSTLPYQETPDVEACLKIIESYKVDKTLSKEEKRTVLRDNAFAAASGYEKLQEFVKAAEMYQLSITMETVKLEMAVMQKIC